MKSSLNTWADAMQQKVDAFLKGDRQWLRVQRIAHALQQRSVARTAEDRWFWQQILDANQR